MSETMKSNAEFIEDAILLAQAQFRIALEHEPLKIGQLVAHPDEATACEVTEILPDGTVIIAWEPGRVRVVVPVAELFDPNVAMQLAKQAKLKALAQQSAIVN